MHQDALVEKKQKKNQNQKKTKQAVYNHIINDYIDILLEIWHIHLVLWKLYINQKRPSELKKKREWGSRWWEQGV